MQLVERPCLTAPATDSHKYRRGLLGIIGGSMPGASLLAAAAAQAAGAGYVKLLAGQSDPRTPPDVVTDTAPLAKALADPRLVAVLVGPGLGREEAAKAMLTEALRQAAAMVIDADALMLLTPDMLSRKVPMLATPHDGELEACAAVWHNCQRAPRARASLRQSEAAWWCLPKAPTASSLLLMATPRSECPRQAGCRSRARATSSPESRRAAWHGRRSLYRRLRGAVAPTERPQGGPELPSRHRSLPRGCPRR